MFLNPSLIRTQRHRMRENVTIMMSRPRHRECAGFGIFIIRIVDYRNLDGAAGVGGVLVGADGVGPVGGDGGGEDGDFGRRRCDGDGGADVAGGSVIHS